MVAVGNKTFRQMRPDETGTTRNQITQRASLEHLGIVVTIARYAFSDVFRIIFMRSFEGLLGAVSIRIRIITIRIVIVRSPRIHCVQYNTENSALDASQQVACAGESLFGRFSTADDKQDSIRLNGQNDRIGCSHDGRRVDYDKLKL